MAKRAVVSRYSLVLEPAEQAAERLGEWLGDELDTSALRLRGVRERGVVVAVAATSEAKRIAPLVDALDELKPAPVSIRLGARLEFYPSRESACTVVLPADCSGIGAMASGLAALIPPPGSGLGLAQWVRPHMVVAESPEGRLRVPVRRVGALPSYIRGPIDAVRLGLYCAQITAQGKRIFQLAQIELPVEAAVR